MKAVHAFYDFDDKTEVLVTEQCFQRVSMPPFCTLLCRNANTVRTEMTLSALICIVCVHSVCSPGKAENEPHRNRVLSGLQRQLLFTLPNAFHKLFSLPYQSSDFLKTLPQTWSWFV